jgi:hypothetical protein
MMALALDLKTSLGLGITKYKDHRCAFNRPSCREASTLQVKLKACGPLHGRLGDRAVTLLRRIFATVPGNSRDSASDSRPHTPRDVRLPTMLREGQRVRVRPRAMCPVDQWAPDGGAETPSPSLYPHPQARSPGAVQPARGARPGRWRGCVRTSGHTAPTQCLPPVVGDMTAPGRGKRAHRVRALEPRVGRGHVRVRRRRVVQAHHRRGACAQRRLQPSAAVPTCSPGGAADARVPVADGLLRLAGRDVGPALVTSGFGRVVRGRVGRVMRTAG